MQLIASKCYGMGGCWLCTLQMLSKLRPANIGHHSSFRISWYTAFHKYLSSIVGIKSNTELNTIISTIDISIPCLFSTTAALQVRLLRDTAAVLLQSSLQILKYKPCNASAIDGFLIIY